MKHTGKALILAGILLVCGMTIFAVGWGILIKAPEDEKLPEIYEEKTYTTDGASIERIKARLTNEEIRFEPGEGDKIEIVYWDNVDSPEWLITENSEILNITREPDFHFFSIPNITVPFAEMDKQYEITVRIPESYAGAYDLYSDSGLLSLSDLTVEQELVMEIASGEIRLDNVTCKGDMQLEMSSGKLTMNTVEGIGMDISLLSGICSLTDITGSGDCRMEMNSGVSRLENLKMQGNLELGLTSGNIEGTGISANMLTIDETSGRTLLSEVNVEEGLNVYATSGRISVDLMDEMDAFTIISDITSGTCNLPEYYRSGDKELNATVTSGNITISFEEH